MNDTPSDAEASGPSASPDGDAHPQRIGGCQCDWMEAENRRLWKRAAEADYAAVRADLRGAQLRLVLSSALCSFAKPRRRFRSDGWRIGRIETVTLQRWWRTWESARPETFNVQADAESDVFQMLERLRETGPAGVAIAEHILADRVRSSMRAAVRSEDGDGSRVEWGVRYDDGTLSDAVINDFDDALQQVGRNIDCGARIVTRTRGGWNDVACCVCGSAAVVYSNYKEQPFCAPCADGDGHVESDAQRDDAEAKGKFLQTMSRLRETDPLGAAFVERVIAERIEHPMFSVAIAEGAPGEEVAGEQPGCTGLFLNEAALQHRGPWWLPDAPVPVLDRASFYIGSDSQNDSAHWAYVTHEPCGTDVFSGQHEPTNPSMDMIWAAMAAHRCPDRGDDKGGGADA
jgi:hypothetical protein